MLWSRPIFFNCGLWRKSWERLPAGTTRADRVTAYAGQTASAGWKFHLRRLVVAVLASDDEQG